MNNSELILKTLSRNKQMHVVRINKKLSVPLIVLIVLIVCFSCSLDNTLFLLFLV